jgi:hypothetical protein
MKLSDRPESFVTKTGKTIVVEKQLAVTRDRILKRGSVCSRSKMPYPR